MGENIGIKNSIVLIDIYLFFSDLVRYLFIGPTVSYKIITSLIYKPKWDFFGIFLRTIFRILRSS